MSVRLSKGDLFKVTLENGVIRFFQFIGKDKTDLNSDVIRIFSSHYTEENTLSNEQIINDEIECHMHTSVLAGIKMGTWFYYSHSEIKNLSGIYFRTSEDVGLHPLQHYVSHRWVVWEMNGERLRVGYLPEKYHSADIGGIYAPIHIIYRLVNGLIPDRYYPSF